MADRPLFRARKFPYVDRHPLKERGFAVFFELGVTLIRTGFAIEHVPKKLLDFFDSDMLQLFEFERFLFDQMILFDRDML